MSMSKPLIQYPNHKPLSELEESVIRILLRAPDEVIEEYKKFLEMPVEVARLNFFHPSNRDEWVNVNRYLDFIRHKLFWSRDHFMSGTSADRFWQGIKGQRAQRVVESAKPKPSKHISEPGKLPENVPQPAKHLDEKEIIEISSDEDEEASVVQQVHPRKKVNEVIVISSDSDEEFVESIIPRKRKVRSCCMPGQGQRKKCHHIWLFDFDDETKVVRR